MGREDPRRDTLFDTLDRGAKRVLRSWAPSIDWGLLLGGTLAGLVAYRNEIWDLWGGMLLAEEAGGAVHRALGGELVIVGHAEAVAALRGTLGV